MNNGVYVVEIYENNVLLKSEILVNGITEEGRNAMLNTTFRGGIQHGSWFFGLIDHDNYKDKDQYDRMLNHAGWQEFTGYEQETRPQWNPEEPKLATLTNLTPAIFTITDPGTIKGFFVASNSHKNGTSGILWSVVLYAKEREIKVGQEIRIKYAYGISQ